MKKSRIKNRSLYAWFGLLLVLPVLIQAQSPKADLFQETQEVYQKAQEMQAHLFSPENFEDGERYLEQADDDFKKGKNRESIQKKLDRARDSFLQSIENTKLAMIHFSDMINARNDALAAEAPTYRQEDWEKAEEALHDAARTLESGNLNGSKARAKKAEELYRAVELESIKANYLDETHALLEKSRKENVKRWAPKTLTRATELVERAEKMLSENRYDTDESRQVAQEAKYEVQHARYLAQAIESIHDQDMTEEDMLLASEKPLQTIADELDLNLRFHTGLEAPTRSIVSAIDDMQRQIAGLQQDLNDKNAQLSTMTQQLSMLESQLGDLKSKEANLTQLMEQQRMLREKFAKIEKTFTPEEAQVLRTGSDVIIRLYGVSFPVGKSVIEPQFYPVLTKVISAIDEYPESGITIEGHTDSFGSDQANQKLSVDRADAVRGYLLANANIDASRITSSGFGETKPIATNETKEGRRKNRRIDVIIHPKN